MFYMTNWSKTASIVYECKRKWLPWPWVKNRSPFCVFFGWTSCRWPFCQSPFRLQPFCPWPFYRWSFFPRLFCAPPFVRTRDSENVPAFLSVLCSCPYKWDGTCNIHIMKSYLLLVLDERPKYMLSSSWRVQKTIQRSIVGIYSSI